MGPMRDRGHGVRLGGMVARWLALRRPSGSCGVVSRLSRRLQAGFRESFTLVIAKHDVAPDVHRRMLC